MVDVIRFIQIIGQISRLRCASLEMTTKRIPTRHLTCSTIVENPLQIGQNMQNKANFKKSQMDVRLNISRNYEKKSDWTFGENKAKVKIGKMNVSVAIMEDYDKNNKQPTTNVIKTKPISKSCPKGTRGKTMFLGSCLKSNFIFLCRKTGESLTIWRER
jgi:hypothetical protein